MSDNSLKTQAFKLKGRLYTLTVLSLVDANYSLFEQQLDEIIQQAPKMFLQAPIVLDVAGVDSESVDLQALMSCLKKHNMVLVGIQGGQAPLNTIAQSQGVAVLVGSSNYDKPLIIESPAAPVQAVENGKTKLIANPIRSGQQVVSAGDLIVASSVSHGAELLADGNIHVYGALRGRALAGISGDKSARIFCQSLEAELVSIAGFYRLRDALESQTGACQIYLQDDHIQIDAL